MYIVTIEGQEQQFELRREATEFARNVAGKANGELTLRNTVNGKTHRWDRETGTWVLPEREYRELMERQIFMERE